MPNLIEIERELLPRKQQGESYSVLRKEMEERGLNEEQIKVVIRSIDNKILQGAVSEAKGKWANQIIYIGFFLALIGILITYGTYTNIINTGNYFILSFGPILSGVGLILFGMAKK